jgi:type I site-specific restriction endonuclease
MTFEKYKRYGDKMLRKTDSSNVDTTQIVNEVEMVKMCQLLLQSYDEHEKLIQQLKAAKKENETNKTLLNNVINELEKYKKLNAELVRCKQKLYNEFEAYKRDNATPSTSSESPSPTHLRM